MSNPLSPFLRLPAEIRLEIYAYLIPTNTTVHISPNPTVDLDAQLPNRNPLSWFWTDSRRYAVNPLQKDLAVTLPLLSICKTIHAEVASVLYGGNEFVFSMGHLSYTKCWSGDNEIFGDSFGAAVAPGVARWMRRVGIEVRVMERGFIGNKKRGRKVCGESGRDYSRLRNWMEGFVSAFGGREERRLESLSVQCVKGRFEAGTHIENQVLSFVPRKSGDEPSVERGCFLEPLSRFRGLKSVTIEGVDEAFAKGLIHVMMGSESRTLKRKSYEVKVYEKKITKKRKGNAHRKVKSEIVRSEKKFWDPVFEWDGLDREEIEEVKSI